MKNTDPIIFILLGATGDLAQKKIMPALLALFTENRLPEKSKIIAYSRRSWDSKQYRDFVHPHLKEQKNTQEFLDSVEYVKGNFDVVDDYKKLGAHIQKIRDEIGEHVQILFHFSVQPIFYEEIIKNLSDAKLEGKFLIEKPFGHDLNSAHALQKHIDQYFGKDIAEKNIFRIDHYLGKSGLWNILKERTSGSELEKKLNTQYIASINVTLFEQIGIEGRGEFYDATGVLRDVVENHVLEILAAGTLEIPSDESHLPQARAHVLGSLKPATDIEQGQYKGYLDEEHVPKNSTTETYIKINTEINTERWKGIPITLEAGKKMSENKREIKFVFKDGTSKIFNIDEKNNAYADVIEAALHDCTKYFVSIDEVIASWKFITPIHDNLKNIPLKKY